jgi:6-phosphogluconolactonase/glucosamine-6-phosphate isomerase/deaminase
LAYFPTLKIQSEPWVRAYNAGTKNKYPERVTTTLTFLKQFDISLAFVCGEEKKPALNNVIEKKGKVNELPAISWHEIKNIKVFTDIN